MVRIRQVALDTLRVKATKSCCQSHTNPRDIRRTWAYLLRYDPRGITYYFLALCLLLMRPYLRLHLRSLIAVFGKAMTQQVRNGFDISSAGSELVLYGMAIMWPHSENRQCRLAGYIFYAAIPFGHWELKQVVLRSLSLAFLSPANIRDDLQ